MSPASTRGPIVIDTDVFGADLVPGSPLIARYEPLIVGRPAFISFQTVAELRFGAALRNWGPARMLKMDMRIDTPEIVHTGAALIEAYVRLASTASPSGMRWRRRVTTPIAGSPQRPSA